MKIHAKLLAILALPTWTQAKVAERLGVSQSTINRWTKGTEPEGDHRDSLSDLYNEIFKFNADASMMAIRGQIEENQTVTWLQRSDQDWAPRPPSDFKNLGALSVATDSMLPWFTRRTTIYYGDATQPADGVGDIVLAQLADGRFILRKLARGSSEDRWTLTIPSASDMVNVEIEAIHPIQWARFEVYEPIPF